MFEQTRAANSSENSTQNGTANGTSKNDPSPTATEKPKAPPTTKKMIESTKMMTTEKMVPSTKMMVKESTMMAKKNETGENSDAADTKSSTAKPTATKKPKKSSGHQLLPSGFGLLGAILISTRMMDVFI